MIQTQPIKERFRVIPPQRFYCFPEDINPLELSVHSYNLGSKCKTLTVAHFDSISFLGFVFCPINKRKFIKAIGYNRGINTVLWLYENKNVK